MNRLLLLLAMFLLQAFAARAEEWMSAQFRCALNLPPEESWQRGNATPLKNVPGDLIFWAVHPESKLRMAVTVTTNVPSNNINSTAMIHRVMECMLKEFGLSIGARSTVEVYGQSFLQLVGTRNEGTGGSTFALARAALRDNILYIAVAMTPSEEDLSADKSFTRVLDTFRFIEAPQAVAPQALPYYNWHYRGMQASLAAAGGILLALGGVMLASRRRRHA